MALPVSDSKARELLELAGAESNRLERHLLLAAAMTELIAHEPIIVGGTAEEYWTEAEYQQTDLDLVAPLSRKDEEALRRVGFRRRGRHWERPGLAAVVEFPESVLEGSMDRTVLLPIGPGHARIIGLDDLYLERLRQATINEAIEGVEFHSALAVAAARFEDIDWKYVITQLRLIDQREGDRVGGGMKRINARIRRRVLRAIREG
jgi:hypothetical protein